MPDPQSNDVVEFVLPDGWEEVVLTVVTMIIVLQLGRLISSALLILLGAYDASLAQQFITFPLFLLIGIPCAALAVVLCLKKLSAASRTEVNDDCENRVTAEDLDGSVESGDRGIVQPGMRAPPVVSSSSSRSGGGVSGGRGVVTAADVELAGGSEQSPEGYGERERRLDMSGDQAVRDWKGKTA